MDVYANFAQLEEAEREGVDFCITATRREKAVIAVVAPHGGEIEPGTSEAARAIAADDLSLALFEGRKSAGNARLHITSTRFDEPRCLALVRASDRILTVHGEGSAAPVVFLGGRDRALGRRIRSALEKHGYRVEIHANPALQGLAAENICNRGRRGAGVQFELSLGLRRMLFESLNAEGLKKPAAELARFAAAVRCGLFLRCPWRPEAAARVEGNGLGASFCKGRRQGGLL
jgi:phage replication-related protein YjqB (UPF0714/DUF867 family)